MSVTLIYGPGVPVLYFVAAFGFGLRFAVEKWFDLRVYKRPPLYSQQLLNSFDDVLTIMLVLHAAFSHYLVSVAGGTLPAAETKVDLARPHVAPMIAASGVACLCVLLKLGAKHRSCATCMRTKFPCGSCCFYDVSKHTDEDLEPFSVVYEQDLLGNEDDDYFMDEKEQLCDMQAMFVAELQKQYSNGRFEDKELYRRLLACVKGIGREVSDSQLPTARP
jgi:hypothetical protein